MIKAFDCATPLNAALSSLFYSQGYETVARYLVPFGNKRLTGEEADIICLSGIKILSVYETAANRPKGGAANGEYDGKTAFQVAKSIYQPIGSAIYFAVDYDAQKEDYNLIYAYLKAAQNQIPGYKIGVYGSSFVIDEMYSRGAADYYWQTYAWSKGRRSPAANFYQWKNDFVQNGIGIDANEQTGDVGEWSYYEPEYIPELSPDVAETIINTWISASWHDTESNELKDRYHWYAEELRRASGINPTWQGWTFETGVADTIINTWISPSFEDTNHVPFKKYYNWLANCLRVASGQSEEIYDPG